MLLLALGLWASRGFYDVAPDEQALVLRLGRYHATVLPGQFHWHAPGIDRVLKQRVTAVLRQEIGYSTAIATPSGEAIEQQSERRMLTGDENVIFADFFVQYRI
ncbi:MAG: FtsH protease activity modulator HflK, partial [Myxococcota bacterium]